MGMHMGIHQAGQDETPGGIETVRVGRHLQDATNRADTIRLDENIGAFKIRVLAVQHLSTRHEDGHRTSSTRTLPAARDCHGPLEGPIPEPLLLQYAIERSART